MARGRTLESIGGGGVLGSALAQVVLSPTSWALPHHTQQTLDSPEKKRMDFKRLVNC